MNRFLLIYVFSISAFASIHGGEIGNGGDIVYCQPSAVTSFEGYYALDYFFSGNVETNDSSLAEINNRIILYLNGIDPQFGQSLKDHFDDGFSFDPSKRTIWLKAENGLPPLNDEKIVQLLPENCRHLPTGEPGWIQAIYREVVGNKIIFHYDQQAVEKLNSRPVQMSYLLTHEWLWNLFSDARSVRLVNQLFHSNDLVNMRPFDFLNYIEDLGLKVPFDLRRNSMPHFVDIFPSGYLGVGRSIRANESSTKLTSLWFRNRSNEPVKFFVSQKLVKAKTQSLELPPGAEGLLPFIAPSILFTLMGDRLLQPVELIDSCERILTQ